MKLKHRLRIPVIVATLLMMAGSPGSLEAQKSLPDGVQDLATQIASKVQQEQKQKIAVLPFRELDGRATVLGTYISEDLVTHLFNLGSFDIVERAMLDRVLGEIKLGQSGLIDPETAKQVGQIAGVDAVVTGTLTDLQSYIAVNTRLIDTTTGRVFSAAQVRIIKDDDLRKILATPMPGSQTAPSSADAPAAARESSPAEARTFEQEEQGFRFSLRGCSRSGSSVRCELLVTNEWQDRHLLLRNSRLIDERGNEWGSRDLAPSRSSRTISVPGYNAPRVVAGVPMRVEVRFDGIHADAKTATLLEISFFSDEEARVQFRNVPLSTQ